MVSKPTQLMKGLKLLLAEGDAVSKHLGFDKGFPSLGRLTAFENPGGKIRYIAIGN